VGAREGIINEGGHTDKGDGRYGGRESELRIPSVTSGGARGGTGDGMEIEPGALSPPYAPYRF